MILVMMVMMIMVVGQMEVKKTTTTKHPMPSSNNRDHPNHVPSFSRLIPSLPIYPVLLLVHCSLQHLVHQYVTYQNQYFVLPLTLPRGYMGALVATQPLVGQVNI